VTRRIDLRATALVFALATTGLLALPSPGHPQTAGMKRRQQRRANRDDARATRQAGRHEARDKKQACKDAGGSGMECRQEKRQTKQAARQKSRDVRWGAEGTAPDAAAAPAPH
jgi:hypothetical protein